MGRRILDRLLGWALPTVLFGLLAVVNARHALQEERPIRIAFSATATVLWVGFLLAVQRRPESVRRDRSPLAVVTALGSSLLTVPVGVAGTTHTTWRLGVGLVLLLAGWVVSIWSLAVLGRRFGVLADARGLVTSGPYCFVRHPLYLGELTNLAGLVVGADRVVLATAAWLALVAVQWIRSGYEERVLADAYPAYDEYRRRVPARIVPRLA